MLYHLIESQLFILIKTIDEYCMQVRSIVCRFVQSEIGLFCRFVNETTSTKILNFKKHLTNKQSKLVIEHHGPCDMDYRLKNSVVTA